MALYKSIAKRTDMPEAFDAVAGLYRAQGDLAESQAWAAQAGIRWAKRLAVLPEAAYGHALDHELAFGDAKRALIIAQRNFANRPFGESATGLASAYMANQRPADAVRVIEPVLTSGWVAAEPFIVAAEAYALTGQPAKADAAHKRALEINPHSFDRNPGLVWLEH
jgi:tetratricopeptide (TPR) repeat protein